MTTKRLFLCLSLLLTTLVGTPSWAKPQPIDRVVAVVDEGIIMASELQQRLAMLKQQNAGAQLPPDEVLRKQVLERMVVESIQLQMADRAGIRISDAQLNDALQRIAAQNGMSLAQFRQAMAAEGTPFSLAREQIRDEMRVSRVQRFQVGERVQISEQDIDYFLASELGKMTSAAEYELSHILVSVPEAASPADIQAAEEKAQNLISQLNQGADFRQLAIAESAGRNALNGGELGWRKEAQLPGIFAQVVPKLSIGEVSQPVRSSSGFHLVKLTDKRGGSTRIITQSKTRHILVKANELRDAEETKALINDLYQRAKAGADFIALAKEYSDDPGSGANGGDLGWVSPGDMVPAFDQTMQEITPGTVSAPFRSQFGWHILLVEERRDTDVGEQLQRQQVRQMLYSRRFEEELPIWLRKIRAEAYVDIKAL
ncbi:chaperone SurA [Bacterioplanes sanyensis]|jgi:peptidyl-prolyl cis-trans isomerase SurA|uniref:peptidylprolyl isomerase n=1 Tax=Bacterioplanes sanyensis TaxID=1249553 RepID=UPI00167418A7|nr:peptidylprolyl isomerase [Bacterioplanes sanyensis]GGY36473.1 chaperone SurA [Bacterioplanes sanyensis]